MTENNAEPIVVAVGPEPVDAALAFAADEATAEGRPLRLVHIVHVPPMGPDEALLERRELQEVGRRALNDALRSARTLAPAETTITVEMGRGPVVPTLVDAASHANMIVLQRRDLSRARRVITRSVSSGVAARTHVPVVSVPEQWSPTSTRKDGPAVTVGVDVPDPDPDVLRAAAAAARRRGAVLHVLHAWTFAAEYEDIGLSTTEVERWTTRATRDIRSALEGLATALGDVPVRVDVPHGGVADVLVRASRESDLLVVGRHDRRVPFGSHLGPVSRAVLRDAACPVLLVDPYGRARAESGRGEKPAAEQTA